jgi:hypothetical protein
MITVLILAATLQSPGATPVKVPSPTPQQQRAAADLFRSPGIFNTYRNDRCAVTFSYPSNWEVSTSHDNLPVGACQVELRPVTWDVTTRASEYTELPYAIGVSVSVQPLKSRLEQSGFQLLDGAWTYDVGSVDHQTPKTLHGAGWTGYEVTFHSGRHLKAGGPGTVDQATSTIVGNAQRSVSMGGSEPYFDAYVYYVVLRSLVFFAPSEGH